jgi:HK97 family phage prohead protease
LHKQVQKFVRVPLAFKADGATGEVSAVFSTFNLVDKDKDVVLASAFTPGQEVPMTWAHDWSKVVGKGSVRVDPDRAIFEGTFFTDTQAGQEAYRTVKAMGALQEYSFGFQVLASDYETRDGQSVRVIKQAKIFEVSPVLVGAGEHTGTIAIKEATPEAKSDVARDFNTVRQTAQVEEDLHKLNWEMQDTLRESVGSILGDDTLDMPTKLAMVRTSVAQYGEALVAWAQRAMALQASGVDVELDGVNPAEHKGQPYSEQAEAALAAAKALVGRSALLADVRAKDGRVLSTTNRAMLAGLRATLASVSTELDALLAATEPPKALSLDYLKCRLRASGMALPPTQLGETA